MSTRAVPSILTTRLYVQHLNTLTLSSAKRDNPLSRFAEKIFSDRPVLILVVKFDIALCNDRAMTGLPDSDISI